MANLIGTGLNQVPTNGLLGNMAFQNKEAVSMDLLGVSGNLIVNGNVGIGTSSPAYKLDVAGTGYFSDNVTLSRTNTAGSLSGMTITNAGTSSSYAGININSGAVTSQFFNDAAGNAVVAGAILRTTTNHPIVFGTNATERMRLTADGNLGLGVTPSAWLASQKVLEVSGWSINAASLTSTLATNAYVNASSQWIYKANGFATRYDNVTGQHLWYTAASGTAGNAITFTQAMTLDASGNLGLGVTPSAWGTNYKAIQASRANLYGAATYGWYGLLFNAYSDNTNFIYQTTNRAGEYRFDVGTGAHAWFNAPSGTAGNNATFTEAMRLDASGNLGLGVTPAAWTTNSKAIQLGVWSAFYQNASGYPEMSFNSYQTGGSTWTYLTTGNPATRFVQDAGAFRFFTAASGTAGNAISFTQTMTLDSEGRLGIGTTSPSPYKLNVNRGSQGAVAQFTDGVESTFVISTASGILNVGQANNFPMAFLTNSTEKMRITAAGDVGIGTSSPTAKLHIYEPTAAPTRVRVLANGGQQAILQLAGNGTTFGTTSLDIFQDGGSDAYVANRANASTIFWTNNTERMRITAAGNLQLGTASLATTATNGFPYIPTCAGVPTGTPTAITGYAPMVVDSTNNKLYVYVGGAWQAMN